MTVMTGEALRVAIPKSVDGNGIAEAIFTEIETLGHHPEYFPLSRSAPANVDVIFLFGPFGKFLHIPAQFRGQKLTERPVLAYWNTEGLPDLNLAQVIVHPASLARSWIGRWSHSDRPFLRRLAEQPPFSRLESRFLRFRYLGDYLYAHRQGWVDVFADISAVYAEEFRRYGIPALTAPFGSFPDWYEDMQLERDIDVLWMGKRASHRRSEALDQLRSELQAHGVDIYMVDNEEHPFVFGEDRTRLLNRTKITLNLLRTWYDENSLRISIAAPNRSLIVSEPLLPHVPQYQPGVHYISAPIPDLARTILHYLENEAERRRIAENAYQLTTTQVTWRRSMQTILEEAARVRNGQAPRRVSAPAGALLTPERARQ